MGATSPQKRFLTTSLFVKHDLIVYIVTRRHLSEAVKRHPNAAGEIAAWIKIVESVRWSNFQELRNTFPDADNVDGYVVFNIRRNRYRLITVVHYAKSLPGRQTEGHVYVRSFLTHTEYDDRANWDRRFGNK